MGRGGEIGPRQRGVFSADVRLVIGVGGRIDVCAGVDGEEGESCGCAAVDIGRRLEMIGVCAHALAPAFLEDAPGGGIHHLLGRAAGALQFTDRLLCEDHSYAAHRPRRAHMARRRQPQPVAATRRRGQPEWLRPQPRQTCAQRHRVGVRLGAEQQVLSAPLVRFACPARESRQGRAASRRQDPKLLACRRRSKKESGVRRARNGARIDR
jgi:hypothetical protein